jgi:hypothetical protein
MVTDAMNGKAFRRLERLASAVYSPRPGVKT